jgi:acetyl-CoA synthetase
LAGADSVFDAFCLQAGLARCDTLGTLCETLKLFHTGGVLRGRKVLIMGASGGDMAMTSDVARSLDLDFAPLSASHETALRDMLTDRVTVANPFDIHTYLWFDPPALGRVFSTVLQAGYDAVGFMLDCPPEQKADSASFDAVIDVFIAHAAAAGTQPTRAALIASLPETLNARIRARCLAAGVVPLQGQREALEALALAGAVAAAWVLDARVELQRPAHDVCAIERASAVSTLSEVEGKRALSTYGVPVPAGRALPAKEAAAAALSLGFPVVLKAVGAHLEHKSEVGGVVLNLRNETDVTAAAERLTRLSPTLLIEQMTVDGVAEILAGIVVDPQFGQVLVLGAGGVLTELVGDSVTLLPPWTAATVRMGIDRLSAAKLLAGYRGKPPGDLDGLIEAVLGVARYATAHVAELVELDVNPIIVRPRGLGVVAVDTLIRLKTNA